MRGWDAGWAERDEDDDKDGRRAVESERNACIDDCGGGCGGGGAAAADAERDVEAGSGRRVERAAGVGEEG